MSSFSEDLTLVLHMYTDVFFSEFHSIIIDMPHRNDIKNGLGAKLELVDFVTTELMEGPRAGPVGPGESV